LWEVGVIEREREKDENVGEGVGRVVMGGIRVMREE
jgi:hypothetical protein